ncbi:MAG: 2-oxoacid:acceptor oxidoreductase subunit alpha [Myxococcales bacterium]
METTAQPKAQMSDNQPSHLKVVPREVEERDAVTIRFCGDSGDGMQLTGSEFTKSSALAGNDLATFPDYPAEIRAPAGTLPGVSGFQVQFSSHEIYTPGDAPDVLVAMNPAALKTNLQDLVPNGILIINTDAFNETNLQKAGYKTNPVEDGSLAGKYQLFKVDINKMTERALEGSGLNSKEVGRCKNMFALGMMCWMYGRPTESLIAGIHQKFAKNPPVADANVKAIRAGFNYGETTEIFTHKYEVKAAKLAPGKYRNITGNQAAALGFVAAAQRSGVELWLGSYPITPASDILHELSAYKNFGIYTFQAEDEIAGICSSIGAAFGGKLALTTSSGPGVALKTEAMGLALMLELPLVICDVQRGGPSTGLPTKTEQADLLQAVYGRNSESPIPVIASSTPGDCFDTAYEAFRLAVKYMTPVIFLTDGYLANGSEPWLIPDARKLPPIEVKYRTDPEGFYPYLRDPQTLARPWAVPGTPGLEHRIGGLEKDFTTGNVSYDPMNHERMVRIRAQKVAGIAKELPPTQIFGKPSGDVLVIGWGGTYGAIHQAVEQLQQEGKSVSHVHLRYLNPLPSDLGDIMKRFTHVLVAELNLGQLIKILRDKTLIDCQGLNKIQGKPFKVSEVVNRVKELAQSRGQKS